MVSIFRNVCTKQISLNPKYLNTRVAVHQLTRASWGGFNSRGGDSPEQ